MHHRHLCLRASRTFFANTKRYLTPQTADHSFDTHFFVSGNNRPRPTKTQSLDPKRNEEVSKMFFKQYNYKPRSNSQSSQTGSGAQLGTSPPKETNNNANNNGGNVPAGVAGRRRVSPLERSPFEVAVLNEAFTGIHALRKANFILLYSHPQLVPKSSPV